jgi:hypothetical protein
MLERNTVDGTEEAPTAAEFIPAEEVPGPNRTDKPMVRIHQATGDGGLEMVAHEPYDDTVKNHVFVCEECGHDEPTANGMGNHLEHNHQ